MEGLALEIAEQLVRRLKIERQRVGAQRLMYVAEPAVFAVDRVFPVAEQGMPCGGELRANLVRAPGDTLDFQE